MITYQEEKLSDILPEMKPLLEEHWEEVAWYKDTIKLNPDYDMYLMMEERGRVHVSTARDDGKLVGYTVNFVAPNPHYSDHVYAVNDIIFLLPEYRHGFTAKGMIDYSEQKLEEMGVSVMTFHMKLANPFTTLLESCGFDCQELLFSKKLGE